MKKKFLGIATTLFIFTLFFPSMGSAKRKPKMREGVCTKVIDAAHIIVSNDSKDVKIRLLGIDTIDDIVFPTYSKIASKFVESLIGGVKIVLEYPSGRSKDDDGYVSALVYRDNILINTSILEEGHGFYSSFNVSKRYSDRFKKAKKKGKDGERGFWSKGSASMTSQQMNDFMSSQMNSNMGMFMNQNMQQMLPAVNKDKK